MAGRRCLYNGGDGSNMTSVLLNNKRPADSFFLSASSSSLLGSKSMVSFEDTKGRNNYGGFFLQSYDQDEIGDEEYDEYFQQPEKKRRLKADQIQFLEKSFETDNKLEPDRKIQLAKDLGLQPRQVAVWFQNRRARWKNKTLERDYEVLQNSYDSLKADYDNLVTEKEKLKAEVLDLTDKLLLKEKEKGDKMMFEKQETSEAPQDEHMLNEFSEGEAVSNSVIACKQEDLNLVKSDAFDSDSTNHSDGVYSRLMEPVYRSFVLEPEPDQSDASQDEDNLNKSLLVQLAYVFPNIGDFNYPDPPANSCYLGLPLEEDQTYGFWGY